MKLEDQVPDREYCERLKELRMTRGTYFHWWEIEKDRFKLDHFYHPERWTSENYIAAPTVAELGEMLSKLPSEQISSYFFRVENRWLAVFRGSLGYSMDKKEANARAKLLIWCVENGYVKW
jgi:hypothetical protein